MWWRMLERGGDLEQLTSGGGIGGEGSSVVRCLHLTSSSVSRDEPNWTHRSVFERKKSFSKTQFWELRKQIKCSVWVQCRSTTCKAKSWLGDITCWTCPTFAHSDQQSLSLPWFKSFMVQQNLKPKVLFCEKAKFLCFIPTISKHQPFHSKRSFCKVQKPKKRQE